MIRLCRLSALLASAVVAPIFPVLVHVAPASATPALAVPSAVVCGVADAATMSAPTAPPPTNAFTVIAEGFSASALIVSGSTLHVLDVTSRTLRRYTLDGTLLGSFSVPWSVAAPSFAVDDSGNIYLSRAPSTLVKVSPTGAELWQRVLPGAISAVYGIGAGDGFRAGVVVANQAGSSQYDSAGTSFGSSPISGTAFSPAPQGGIVATDGRYVRRYSAAGELQVLFGDRGGVNDMQFSGGPYHFVQQGGAAVDATGNFYVPDATRGIHGATPQGYHRGLVDDPTVGYLTERSWITPAVTSSGERRFYVATGGRFHGNQKVSWVKETDLAQLVTAPRTFKNRVLGFGAGLTSSAVGQYFPAGTMPSVQATFDPWWVDRAGGLSLRYTVRDRAQTMGQLAVPATTIPLPNTAEGLASVPLTLPAARPGAYEIDAHLVDGTGAAVGATCYRYAVGATGHRLDFASLPPGSDYGGPNARRGVALAHQLGISALRATANWERLLPDGPAGSMDFSVHDAEFTAAAQEAAATGTAFFVQLGSGLAREQQLISTGTWGARVKELVKHFHDAGVQIAGWEVWSEPNNNFGPAPDYVAKALAPAFQAVREGDPDAKVIGGSVLGMDLGYFEALGEAGAYPMMDVVGMHPYTGHNRSIEEQGIPQNMRDLRTILARYGAGQKPLWNTETAWWSDGPANFFPQADKAARTLLWNRILGVERWSYLLLEAGYGDYGLTYSFIEGADSPDYVKAGALGTMTADWQTGDRPLLGEVATGIPHAYAARFGSRPGGTDSVLAAWTDDVDVPAHLVATASTSPVQVTVTDVLGFSSTRSLVPGSPSPLNLGGGPVYVTAPAGVTLSLEPPTSFGANLAAASAGATATATSATSTNPASEAIDGLPSARLARTSSIDASEGGNANSIPAWASGPEDDAPALTVQLAQPAPLDRVVVLTHSNGSINPGLRNSTLELRDQDGQWSGVASVQDQFFDRGILFSFPARAATALRISVGAVNDGGYAGGAPPWFWPTDAASRSNASEVWYGPALVYEVEAYAGTEPPPSSVPAAPTNLTARAASAARVDLTWTGSPGATGYKLYRSTDGTDFSLLAGGVSGTSYSDTAVAPSTTYHYRVIATSSAGDSPPSDTASATTPSTDPALPPPSGLEVGGANDNQINIRWNAVSGATAYKVERSLDNVTFVVRGSTSETFWADVGLSPGTTYWYRVRSTNETEESAPSSTVSATTTGGSSPPQSTPPAAPTGLVVTGSTVSEASLAWNPSDGATAYKLERSPDAGTWAPVASGIVGTSYTDSGLSPQTTYHYRVRATNAAGESAASSTVSVTTASSPQQPTPPPAPTGLVITSTTGSQVSLGWNPSEGASGYMLERSPDAVAWTTVATGIAGTSYTDSGLTRHTTYHYRVSATNAAGSSPPSATVSARTKRK